MELKFQRFCNLIVGLITLNNVKSFGKPKLFLYISIMFKYVLKVSLFISIFLVGQSAVFGQSEARLAQQYMKAAQYDKAIVLYQELYKKNPAHTYYSGLFTCYFASKDYNAAKKLIKKHQKRSKNYPNTHFDLALVELELNNEEKANQHLEECKTITLKNRNSVSQIAGLFEKYDRISDALDLYKRADELHSNLSYKFKIAEYYGRLNQDEQMIGTYLSLIQNYPKRAHQIKSLMLRSFGDDEEKMDLLKNQLVKRLQTSSESVLALDELLIWLYLQKGNFDRAFKQEMAIDRRYKLNGFRFLSFSQICQTNKQYDLASQSLNIVIKYGEEHPNYLNALESKLSYDLQALLGKEGEDKTEAIQKLQEDFKSYFEKYSAHTSNVLVQKKFAEFTAVYLEDDTEAIRILENAIIFKGLTKEIAECKLYLADLLLTNSRLWDALLYYSQIDKDFEHGVLGHEARFRKAKVSFYQGDFQWSKDQLDVLKQSTSKLIANNAMYLSLVIQESLNLDSNTFALEMYARADLYVFQKRYSKAKETLKTLLKLSTNDLLNDDTYFLLSKIEHTLGNYEQEETYLQKIITDYPDILVDNALFNLAKLYDNELNNPEKALETYQNLLTNYPSSYWTSQARVNYRKLKNTL